MAQRRPGERWRCTCGAQLVGARTVRGAVAPIAIHPKANGNVWLGKGAALVDCPDTDLPWHETERAGCPKCHGSGQVREVRCATLAGPILDHARQQGMALYLNHFADCPERARFGSQGVLAGSDA